jgi:glycosyltransferase involved in cell wall biosynthesis
VVLDGPVKPCVRKVLDAYQKQAPFSVDLVEFSENRGLGAALADGLETCHHDIVARVDTDDINLPTRFEIQHQYLEASPEVSVVGGFMEEVYLRTGRKVYCVRSVPTDTKTISESARFRNPLNHPTVMFRKEHVLKSGNYEPLLWFEDYYLWARMIMKGYHIANIDHVLVRTTVDNQYFRRRGGLSYVKKEILLTKKLRNIGFHSIFHSIRFITVRIVIRFTPVKYRSWFYFRALREQNNLEPID